jgi:asparagine synthase (glutamine-hydrolysing)
MLRYLALARVDDSLEAHAAYRHTLEAAATLASRSALVHGYRSERLCLLYVDTTPGRIRVSPLGHQGAVIGTLFRNSGGANGPIDSLSDGDTDEILMSRGELLVSRYWGQYVALIERPGRALRIVRDPTGGFPCYYVHSRGIVFAFSHLNDCASVLPIRLSVNYSHLHLFLRFQQFVARDTGFNEIASIHAGEAIDFQGQSVTRTSLWTPSSFCRSPARHEDIGESVLSMREAVTKCVQSWAACRSSILHELSGGLDSSIVLACLAAMPATPRIACCTHVTDSPEGDERYYARLMARHAHVPLAELPLRPRIWNRIEDLVQVRDPISPLFTVFQCSDDSEIRKLVEAGSFDCTFSGQGGDQLFHRIVPSITAADYAWVHRLHPRLLRVLFETAFVSRRPLWSIARAAIRYGCLRQPYDVWRESEVSGFIRAPPVDVSQSCHPWLAVDTRVPPAKLLQVMCLAEFQTYFARPRTYVDEIHPLVSQPLLECCLRIPTYVLSYGGTDRTIARAAFQDALPLEIVQRSSKGAVTRYFYEAIYGNHQHIRPFLLDGLLADQGLLDRTELKKTLDDPATVARGRSLTPIMTATICEMWLRAALSLVHAAGSSGRGVGEIQLSRADHPTMS